jgi:hypothetical protein
MSARCSLLVFFAFIFRHKSPFLFLAAFGGKIECLFLFGLKAISKKPFSHHNVANKSAFAV